MADQNASGDSTDARPNLFSYKTATTRTPPPPMLIANEKYSDLSDEDFEYKMNHKRRGIAVIINNMKFQPSTLMGPRSGSDVDRDNLYQTLISLGFRSKDIIVRDDQTAHQMQELMEQVASADHTDADCVFVSILSHGDEGQIYGVDGPLQIEALLSPFKEGTKSLVGKPKIFLLQACRGEKLDEGTHYQTDAGEKRARVYKIAKESDFLIAYSVVPGYYSWRNCSNGSWFLQAFCEVFRSDGRRLEFVQALTRVNRMVSYTFESNARPEYMSMKKQSPCITSMLTKSLYF